MKQILIIILCLWSFAYAQTTGYFRYDTVRIQKSGGNSELYIENATRGVTGGVLTNAGNGRTIFSLAPALTGFWKTTGNSGTVAGTNFLGTTDAQDVVFKRNSSEVMRLYSASNFVGIGTATPTSKLTVNGSIKILSDWLRIKNYIGDAVYDHPVLNVQNSRGTSIAPTYLLSGDEVGAIAFREGTDNNNVGDGEGGAGFAVNASENWTASALGANIDFFTTPNGSIIKTNRLSITNDGKVGIGTTLPGVPLQIDHTGSLNAALQIGDVNTIASRTGIYMRSTTEGRISVGSNAAAMTFYNGGSSGSERMRIDSAGRVGIGTAAPSNTLHINGTFRLVDGSQGTNKILQSDVNGLSTWVAPSTIVTATPTWQQTLTAGSTLTGTNSVNGGGNGFAWTNNQLFQLGVTGSGAYLNLAQSSPNNNIIIRDSILIQPYVGKLNIDTLNYSSNTDDSMMVWRKSTGYVGMRAIPTSSGGTVTGTLTANRVTVGAGTTSLQDFSNFTYNDAPTTGNGLAISNSAGTTGNLMALTNTGTAAASNTKNVLAIVSSGANATIAQTVSGLTSSVTNTNVTSGTNVAATFNASGATTNNVAILAPTGKFGIGTSTLGLNNTAAETVNLMEIVTGDATNAIAALAFKSYGTTAGMGTIHWYKSRGSEGTPTALQSGDYILSSGGRGYDGSNWIGSTASMQIAATQNWSAGVNGTKWVFQSTRNGQTAAARGQDVEFGGGANINIPSQTQIDQVPAFRITETLPASSSLSNYVYDNQITSTNSGAAQIIFSSDFLSGGTNNKIYSNARFANSVSGTGTSLFTTDVAGTANFGAYAFVNNSTVGYNCGFQGGARGGAVNTGIFGAAMTDKNSGTNIGVVGFGLNAGTSSKQLGGYFGLNSTTPTFASSGLMCDNGATTSDIFVARDNGTVVFTIADGGGVSTGTTSAAAASAQVDIVSTTKGLLIPRMTNAQFAAISSPATGLKIYSTDALMTLDYNGSAYKSSGTVSGSYSSGAVVGQTVFTITFGGTQPNATYKVDVVPTSVLGAALFYVTNKTTTTFDVTYLAGLTGTVTLDYAIFQ